MTIICIAGIADKCATRKCGVVCAASDTACAKSSLTLVGPSDITAGNDAAGASTTPNACASTRRAASIADVALTRKRGGCAAGDATGARPTLTLYSKNYPPKSEGNNKNARASFLTCKDDGEKAKRKIREP